MMPGVASSAHISHSGVLSEVRQHRKLVGTLNALGFRGLWAADEPAMTLAVYGEMVRAAAVRQPAHHAQRALPPQEGQAPSVASQIAGFVLSQHAATGSANSA
jgi:hypothetical protein